MFDEWFGNTQKIDRITERTGDEQAVIDGQTALMSLYHYETCMFCARVRNTIRLLNLSIKTRDIHLDPDHLQDLIANGGKPTVPCLRIDSAADSTSTWLYESEDIRSFLMQKFGQ